MADKVTYPTGHVDRGHLKGPLLRRFGTFVTCFTEKDSLRPVLPLRAAMAFVERVLVLFSSSFGGPPSPTLPQTGSSLRRDPGRGGSHTQGSPTPGLST